MQRHSMDENLFKPSISFYSFLANRASWTERLQEKYLNESNIFWAIFIIMQRLVRSEEDSIAVPLSVPSSIDND